MGRLSLSFRLHGEDIRKGIGRFDATECRVIPERGDRHVTLRPLRTEYPELLRRSAKILDPLPL